MANLQKFRAHESLNADAAADWQVQSVATVDNTADAIDVSNYHTIHLMTNNDIYFSFQSENTETLLNTSNDLYLMGGDTLYSLRIPKALGNTIYLLLERKGSSDCTVRYVLS
tara:strand:- start:207 stop:542 length:336 start_codon:yes stop_codon:yes gene_type:complete